MADGRAPLEEVIEQIADRVAVPAARTRIAARRRPRRGAPAPKPTSSRMQFSTSSRIRPNVCISDSTSKASSGRAQRKRRSAARSGDCTSAWKRASTSVGSARRPGIEVFDVSPRRLCRYGAAGWRPAAKILRWILLDQPLHLDRVGLAVTVTADRARAAGAFDQHVGEEQIPIDQHRCDVRDVHRVLPATDQLRRVVDHARRRHRDLRRKPQVATAEPAGPEHVVAGDLRPLTRRRRHQPSRAPARPATSEPQCISGTDRCRPSGHRSTSPCHGRGSEVGSPGSALCQGVSA